MLSKMEEHLSPLGCKIDHFPDIYDILLKADCLKITNTVLDVVLQNFFLQL